MFPPQIPYYSTMYQLSPHIKINTLYLVPTSCQCTSSLWGECGDMLMWGKPGGNVETDLLLILLPYHSSIVGRVWGVCWCRENVGKMLTQIFSLFSFQTTPPVWGECGDYVDVGKTWGKCWHRSFPYSPPSQLFHCGEIGGNMLMWGEPRENVYTYFFLILLPVKLLVHSLCLDDTLVVRVFQLD